MKTRSGTTSRTVAVGLYCIGVVLALALAVGGIWADLEASMFDRSLDAEGRLSSFRCPTIMTVDRPAEVRVTLSNSFDRPIEHNVRVHISDGFLTLIREERATVPLEAGERQRLAWSISADDAAYGSVVFVRAYQFPKYPQPDRNLSCGVLVLDIPFLTGGQLVALIIALSVLTMGSGLAIWHTQSRPMSRRDMRVATALGMLALVVLAAVALTLLEFWIPALGAVIISLLMIGGIFSHFQFGS